MLLYSRNDRTRDPEMVRRITEELTKLMPTPKWKLVVDVGSAPPKLDEKAADKRIPDMIKLLAENTPTHGNSPFSPYLPGFTALRLLLLKRNRSSEEIDLANTMLDSYSSYLSSGRNSSETAWMVARDYMLLTQSSSQHTTVLPQNNLQPIHQQQHQPDRQQQIVQHHNPTQQRAPQVQQHQPMQQQLAQVHNVATVQRHDTPVQRMTYLQQVEHEMNQHRYQQLDPNQIQRPHQSSVQQQQNAVTVAPVPVAGPTGHIGHANNNSLVNHMRAPASHPQDALSTLGHFATHAAPGGNSLSENGIAALSHLAQQQHQMAHPNGISALQNDKNGVPGA
mmetsp:Transcript_12452/g.28774  ORF Transcript_12452/g.28774 Transcript_12452/m.28774 type:complete len:336 (+) Transcript_12452:355-1362(+)